MDNKFIEEKKGTEFIWELKKEAVNGFFFSVIEILPLIFTCIIAYTNYLIGKKLIPYLEDFKNKSKKNILNFSPDQESLIKQYLRGIRDKSPYNNISLWQLNNPSIDKRDIISADSFSLCIEASTQGDRKIFDSTFLSFHYISEALNIMRSNSLTILDIKNTSEGPICQVWLGKRGTSGYLLYFSSQFTFILLEKRSKFFSSLTELLARKTRDKYLDYCIKIGEIIQEIES
ncbi:MAG: hypothetical protein ACKPFK_14075 [Dolichospermum sp.]